MRKLALSDEILLSVDKAARYIGGEVNSIMKDKDKVTTRVAFSFPDVYENKFCKGKHSIEVIDWRNICIGENAEREFVEVKNSWLLPEE